MGDAESRLNFPTDLRDAALILYLTIAEMNLDGNKALELTTPRQNYDFFSREYHQLALDTVIRIAQQSNSNVGNLEWAILGRHGKFYIGNWVQYSYCKDPVRLTDDEQKVFWNKVYARFVNHEYDSTPHASILLHDFTQNSTMRNTLLKTGLDLAEECTDDMTAMDIFLRTSDDSLAYRALVDYAAWKNSPGESMDSIIVSVLSDHPDQDLAQRLAQKFYNERSPWDRYWNSEELATFIN